MPSTRTRTLLPLLCALAAGPAARAELPLRLTDLLPGPGSGVPNFRGAVLDDKLYFAATADGGELDLWVYDGISPASMVPGSAELDPRFLVAWQGALYFQGGPSTDRELWRHDGVNPPVEALDLLAAGGGSPVFLTAFGPELCFRAVTSDTVGDELVCWDGATAPDVYELSAGAAGSSLQGLAVLGSRLYFSAEGDGVGAEPWFYENFSPPTFVGDVQPGDPSSNPRWFVQVGTTLYFAANSRVWSAEGAAPPTMLADTLDVEGGLASWHGRLLVDGHHVVGEPDQMHVLRSGALVPARDPNGSIFGAERFFDHRNALYFFSSGSTIAAGDLFRYCGGGLVERVTDHFAGSSYIEGGLVAFQGRIYFSADEDATGRELWAIDPITTVFCDGLEDGHDDGWSASVP